MTDKEKRSQRAQVHIDLEDAQSDLAHAQIKAIQFAQRLREVAAKLEANSELEPSREDFEEPAERRIAPDYQDVLNYAATLVIVNGLKLARQKLFNAQRTASLLPRV